VSCASAIVSLAKPSTKSVMPAQPSPPTPGEESSRASCRGVEMSHMSTPWSANTVTRLRRANPAPAFLRIAA
jgi:hypothetical protein